MLEHQKILILRAANDKDLFRKEIVKSFRWLKSYEIIQLHRWLKAKFGKTHSEVIRDIFQFIAA